MSKFKLASIVLLVCLCVSVGFNVYLGTEHSPKTFVFTWTSEGKEYLFEFTFDTVPTFTGGNLSITAKISRHDFSSRSCFFLFFDDDGDGEFKKWDHGMGFFADNTTHPIILDEGWGTIIALDIPEPSRYHTCVFDDSGYTYRINLPLEELKLKNDLIYVIYGHFWKSFHFDPEDELFK